MQKTINENIAAQLRRLDIRQVEALDHEVTGGTSLEYYESAVTSNAAVYRNHISGRVGNFLESFDVEIRFHKNEIAGSCSCGRSRKICKHIVCLLYSWVNDGQDFMNVEHVLEDVRKMNKDRLVEIVSNIIRHNPGYVDIFMAKEKPDWDEIDRDIS